MGLVGIEVLLIAALTTTTALSFKYVRNRSTKIHQLLLCSVIVDDILLFAAFTMTGAHEAPSWIGVTSVFFASVIGSLLVGVVEQREFSIRGQLFYAASTVALASAVCVASVFHRELRSTTDVMIDAGTLIASAVFIVVCALVILAFSRRERTPESIQTLIGCCLLLAAAGFVGVSFALGARGGLARMLPILTPLVGVAGDISVLLAILAVVGISFLSHSNRLGTGVVVVAPVAIPALLVFSGQEALVALATGMGLLSLLFLKTRKPLVLAIVALVFLAVWSIAAVIGPGTNGTFDSYWPASSALGDGGPYYSNIKLFAQSGIGMGIGKLAIGQVAVVHETSKESLGLLAFALGKPVFMMLVAMTVFALLSIKKEGGKNCSRDSATTLPVFVTMGAIVFCGVATNFGMAPGDVAVPCIDLRIYPSAATMFAVCIVCANPESFSCASAMETDNECVGARPLSFPEPLKWSSVIVTAVGIFALCSILFLGVNTEKQLHDKVAIASLLLSYTEECDRINTEANPLSPLAFEGKTVDCIVVPSVEGYEGEVLVRLVERYKNIVVEHDYRLSFPEGDISADRLWETPRWLTSSEVYPVKSLQPPKRIR